MGKEFNDYPITNVFSVRIGKNVIDWKYERVIDRIVCHGTDPLLVFKLDSALPESIETWKLRLDPREFLVSSINVDSSNYTYSREDDGPYYWKAMGHFGDRMGVEVDGEWFGFFIEGIKRIAGTDDVELLSRGGLITPKMVEWEWSLGDEWGIPKKERNHG